MIILSIRHCWPLIAITIPHFSHDSPLVAIISHGNPLCVTVVAPVIPAAPRHLRGKECGGHRGRCGGDFLRSGKDGEVRRLAPSARPEDGPRETTSSDDRAPSINEKR